jgi:hypothetical protein
MIFNVIFNRSSQHQLALFSNHQEYIPFRSTFALHMSCMFSSSKDCRRYSCTYNTAGNEMYMCVSRSDGQSQLDSSINLARGGPPSLEYDLRKRRVKIALFCTMVLIDSLIIPIVLFYVLWYTTHLEHSTSKGASRKLTWQWQY